MNAINAVSSVLNRSIDALILYVKANGVAIGILLAGVYYYRSRCKTKNTSNNHDDTKNEDDDDAVGSLAVQRVFNAGSRIEKSL